MNDVHVSLQQQQKKWMKNFFIKLSELGGLKSGSIVKPISFKNKCIFYIYIYSILGL
jgi:hypothetical protein